MAARLQPAASEERQDVYGRTDWRGDDGIGHRDGTTDAARPCGGRGVRGGALPQSVSLVPRVLPVSMRDI